MNILYHHRTQGKGAEGVHIRGVVKGFRKLGHNVYVISPPGINPEKTTGRNPYSKKKGILSRALSYVSRSLPQPLFEALEIFYNFRAHYRISGLLRKSNIDFIYERHSFFSFAAVKLAKRFNIPILIEVNELAGEARVRKQCFVGLAKKMERYVFKNGNAIIVVSQFLKNKIKEYGVDKQKIFVMSNAVDKNRFSPNGMKTKLREKYSIKNGEIIIGFVGWFVYWHSIELLIDVFEEVSRRENLHLFLVGDGVLKPKLKNIVKDKGIKDKVVFTGAVPHECTPAYIDLMDICVIPQSNEYRSPIKMFEYMAMSKAVVAPRLGPIEDVITDNINGVLFEPKDENSLRRCLLDLINGSHKREKIGKEARNTVLSKHLWIHNAERIVQIYNGMTKTLED